MANVSALFYDSLGKYPQEIAMRLKGFWQPQTMRFSIIHQHHLANLIKSINPTANGVMNVHMYTSVNDVM